MGVRLETRPWSRARAATRRTVPAGGSSSSSTQTLPGRRLAEGGLGDLGEVAFRRRAQDLDLDDGEPGVVRGRARRHERHLELAPALGHLELGDRLGHGSYGGSGSPLLPQAATRPAPWRGLRARFVERPREGPGRQRMKRDRSWFWTRGATARVARRRRRWRPSAALPRRTRRTPPRGRSRGWWPGGARRCSRWRRSPPWRSAPSRGRPRR